jgi:phage tail protein X
MASVPRDVHKNGYSKDKMTAQDIPPTNIDRPPGRRIARTAALFAAALLVAASAVADTPANTLDLLAQRFAKQEEACRATENERVRLIQENAALTERLRICDGGDALLKQLTEQSVLLTRLSERLDARIGGVEAALAGQRPPADTGSGSVSPLADENAQLRGALEVSERRLSLLIDQFGEAHRLRLAALADAAAARDEIAALTARLQQHQQAVTEATFRAEKAEKLNAALEQEQARLLTENERLTRELAAARENGTQSSSHRHSARPPGLREARYRVRANDTLSRISHRVYGDAQAWGRIYRANRAVVKDPNDLAPGLDLVIP